MSKTKVMIKPGQRWKVINKALDFLKNCSLVIILSHDISKTCEKCYETTPCSSDDPEGMDLWKIAAFRQYYLTDSIYGGAIIKGLTEEEIYKCLEFDGYI